MRNLIVVDLETSGLASHRKVLEVAAVNVDTGDELYFAPFVDPDEFKWAERKALQINRYFERGVWSDMVGPDATVNYWKMLQVMLDGQTFGGSNPTFDSARLPFPPVWHHRLADLAAYAAGKLNLDPTELPGASTVCEMLDVTNHEPHSALGDARAAAECFRILREMM
jgi:DNA polymerase-3 subunit epsilon